MAVNKSADKNEFTIYAEHCIKTANGLETRGNLDAATNWRSSAARMYRFMGDIEKSREQYAIAAGLYEKMAAAEEKKGYIGHAAFYLEIAGGLHNNLRNKDKAKESYSKAAKLTEQNLEVRKREDPEYIDTLDRDRIADLMRKVEGADKI